MTTGANVRSLDALRRLRPALVRIEGDLAVALAGLRQELTRGLTWLDHDCPSNWQREVRTGFDRIAQARTELNRKQMITVAGHKADCIEEQKALRRAKERLELAQEKLRICRQWSIKVHRQGDEYKSRIGRVEQSLAHRIPMLLANLDRMVTALEAYASSERRPLSETQGVVESNAPEPTASADPASANESAGAQASGAEAPGAQGPSAAPAGAPGPGGVPHPAGASAGSARSAT
jgi:hypothetical protein